MKVKACLFSILLIFASYPAYGANPFPSIAMFEWQTDGAAETGFRDGIQKSHPDARFYVYNLAGKEELFDLYLKTARERNHDLYYASGTILTKRLLAVQKQAPVIFTMVQAPVEEGLIASWETSENNAAGISNRVPILNQLKTLKRIVNFKNLGVFYQQDNPDSRQQLHELERLQSFLKYRLKKISVTAENAAVPLSKNTLKDVDAIYITNAPLFERYGAILISQLNSSKIPTLTADMTMVINHGALLGLVPDNYRIGRLAALKAQQALGGIAPKEIPSRDLDFFMVILNMNTARKLRVQVPFSLLVIADTIIR